MSDLFKEYHNVGKYKISNLCLESYPCQHFVYTDDGEPPTRMRGDEIYYMLKKDGLSSSHFDKYFSHAECKYSITTNRIPTVQELMEMLEDWSEQRKKEKELNNLKTNSASKRLEKLRVV
jgi:hypothetical protein